MDFKKSKSFLIKLALIYCAFVLMIYAVAQEQFRRTPVTSDALTPSGIIGEITDGVTVRQRLEIPVDQLDSLSIMPFTYGQAASGNVLFALETEDGTEIAQSTVDASTFKEASYTAITFDEPISGYRGETLTLVVTTQGCAPGQAIGLYTGNSIAAGRFDIAQSFDERYYYTVNGEAGMGRLCVKLAGVNVLTFYKIYWFIVAGVLAILVALCLLWWKGAKKGRNNPLVAVCLLYTRYGFLVRQLVSRDFKTKYKRSVLGMLWSFLNPLLTMAVQYLVFSFLFANSIENFTVYLMSGIVFFSFFSEAVSMGMTSITGNAALIKKVYMPKYIYPISRIFSSLVNFSLTLVPLFLVVIVTGVPLRPSLLLLLFDILCLLGFTTGMSLILSTAMTFFQDTQFLWGVVSMLWMYLTPIIYPVSIISPRLLPFFRMNPLYQYITFARTCIIDGISPAPISYLWCILSAAVTLLTGILVFKRHQNQFILHL